jgi:hypothetical protein
MPEAEKNARHSRLHVDRLSMFQGWRGILYPPRRDYWTDRLIASEANKINDRTHGFTDAINLRSDLFFSKVR